MQNWMQQLLSLQQRCSFVSVSDLWRRAAAVEMPLRLGQKDAVSCDCVTPKCDQPRRQLSPILGACQTGPRASSGRVQRPRSKVPHVFVQSRSLEYTSSPRGAPSQRPGDNSTRIARTTAKRHSKAARESRSSCSYPSSWLLPPRDDASRREPRGYSGAEVTCRRTTEGGRLHIYR